MKMKKFLKRFDAIKTWDEWHNFDKRYFKSLVNPESKSGEEVDRELRRQPITINGILWKPIRKADAIDPDLDFLSQKYSALIFDRLEPEAAADNAAHPERYARWCVYCGLYTKERSPQTCPVCEHELLDLPLNDMED